MKKKRKLFKKLFTVSVVLSIVSGIASAVVYKYVNDYSSDFIYTDMESVPKVYTALVLGARVYKSGRLSSILYDRMISAYDLYKRGTFKKFLLSGDHGTRCYDEVNAMRKFLLKKGVPGKNIFMDHAGFDTYSSMARARKIFCVRDIVIVTQEYHLPRAVYIARKVNINAYGFKADRRNYLYIRSYRLREYLAVFKAFMDVARKRNPRFLGKVIPVDSDGTLSWD